MSGNKSKNNLAPYSLSSVRGNARKPIENRNKFPGWQRNSNRGNKTVYHLVISWFAWFRTRWHGERTRNNETTTLVGVNLRVRVFHCVLRETRRRGHRRGIPTSGTRRKCQWVDRERYEEFESNNHREGSPPVDPESYVQFHSFNTRTLEKLSKWPIYNFSLEIS